MDSRLPTILQSFLKYKVFIFLQKLSDMKYLVFIFFTVVFWSACSGSLTPEEQERNRFVEDIRQLESALASQQTGKLDVETARTLIARSEAFAVAFPEDSLAAVYLFKAADVARGIGDYAGSIDLWKEVYSKFPQREKAAEALFLVAFTYDKDMEDPENAGKTYQTFLDEFPTHPLAKDAGLLLQYLEAGKSPEELIREFESEALGEQ
jgi:tetratricopeptide (TPR) repeat protein